MEGDRGRVWGGGGSFLAAPGVAGVKDMGNRTRSKLSSTVSGTVSLPVPACQSGTGGWAGGVGGGGGGLWLCVDQVTGRWGPAGVVSRGHRQPGPEL